MCVLLFDVFNGCFLVNDDVFNGCFLVKKQISKGMSNIYYQEKLTFTKLVGKINFLEGKFEEMD